MPHVFGHLVRRIVAEFGVGLSVVVVGLPLFEWFPADLFEEEHGEAAGEDCEFVPALAGEVIFVVDDAGGHGFAPDVHGFCGGELRREVGDAGGHGIFGGDGVGAEDLVRCGRGLVVVDEDFRDAAAFKDVVAVIVLVDLLDEAGDVEAFLEVTVVQGCQSVLDGGGDGFGEDWAQALGEATQAPEAKFQSGEESVKLFFVLGEVGCRGPGVDLVNELVEGDLLRTGATGDVVQGDGAGFVGFAPGNSFDFRCCEATGPGAGAIPAGVAVHALVHIGADDA